MLLHQALPVTQTAGLLCANDEPANTSWPPLALLTKVDLHAVVAK